MHAAVLAGFPEPPTGDRSGQARVLWRLDKDGESTYLYVVSPDRPDVTHLAEQAGWPSLDTGEVAPYGPFLDALDVGQRWAFRLTANPTRYVPAKEGGRAKRLAHVTVAQQEAWLADKAAASGFCVVPAHPVREPGAVAEPGVWVTRRTTHRFRRKGAGAPVTLGTAQFDGYLEVTDPEVLRRALTTGIGPAKAYGCGLMTLARA